jgi:hypothetical protein
VLASTRSLLASRPGDLAEASKRAAYRGRGLKPQSLLILDAEKLARDRQNRKNLLLLVVELDK